MSAARRPYTLLALAETLVRVNGGGSFDRREFPEERKRIDIGDFVTDDRRFRELTGWAPQIGLDEGLAPLARLLPPASRALSLIAPPPTPTTQSADFDRS